MSGGGGGAGGGAGVTGGSGGHGTSAGGAGGSSPGAAGADGVADPAVAFLTAGGSGGGGGAHGYTDLSAPGTLPSAAVTGGAGGAGGAGVGNFGGGGGAGGWGAVVTGGGNLGTLGVAVSGGQGGAGGAGGYAGSGGSGGIGLGLTDSSGGSLTINAAVRGGNGGAGGAGDVGGNGGYGGAGLFGSNVVITIGSAGSVTGGTGGAGGVGVSLNGTNGADGVGISGSNVTVINAGAIAGGGSAHAIDFSGSLNILELWAGATVTGTVAGTNNDILRLGGNADASFDASSIGASAQYRGFASFAKTGTSTWTLTGTNAAALPWSIDAGTLSVNGALANSSFTVNSSGTLGGTGTVGTVTVAAGGMFAPGAAGTPGTSMAVSGNLAFQSGALYLVQINPTAASLANVAGTAALGGTVQAAFAAGSYIARHYTILHAAGLGGTTFSGLATTNLPAGFSAGLSYTATDVLLNLTAVLGTPGAMGTGGFNGNQQAVADALNNFFNTGGSLPPGFLSVFGLTGSALPAALSQLSGEIGTAPQQTSFDAMTLFLGLLTDPAADRAGDAGGAMRPAAYAEESDRTSATGSRRASDALAMFVKAQPAADAQRWSVWASGFGGSQTTDGNAVVGSNQATSRIFGTALGADYRLSPDTVAGFALAGGGTTFGVNGFGSGRSDLFQAGAYVRHVNGPSYLAAALAYGWQNIVTDRTVTVAGADRLRAEISANAFSGRVEGGYRFATLGVGLTPYAAAQVTTFELPAYTETVVSGAAAFALAYAAKNATDSRSELGLRTDKSFATAGGILSLRGRIAWAHDFNPDRSIAATFQALPGASFVVNGAAQASDSALVTATVAQNWLNGWSTAATFEGEWSSVTRAYAGKGVVRYQW
ncbi:MAG: autotransporter domain-containing protein [Rhodoplanes sp.]|nr:autotransporter domain-containing protein [Rhodoplanes sp.]